MKRQRFTAALAVLALILLPLMVMAAEDTSGKKGATLGKKQPYNQLFLEGTSAIVIEGETYDAYETTLTFTEPTADRTITFPNSSGTVAFSATAGSMEYEGATADDFETTLQVTDPTKDVFYEFTIPTDTVCAATGTACAMISSTLATNAIGAANSIWGESGKLVFEGSTANTSEASISAANVTADVNLVIPDAAAASYTIMMSTLATNAPLIANSVWGVSNGLYFTGATGADTNEVFLTVADPGADYTLTLPAATGTIATTAGSGAVKTFTIATDNVVLAAADCGKVYGMGTAAKTFTLPATISGCKMTFINTGAATNNIVTVDPNGADQIFGDTRADNGDKTSHIGDAGEAINNTAATSDRGNFITLIGDGVDGWYILESAGIWAEDTP